MSQTTSTTTYSINIQAGQDPDGGTLTFYATSGATDDFVIALAEAIDGVTWPAGENPLQVSLVRNTNVETMYLADINDTPVQFT